MIDILDTLDSPGIPGNETFIKDSYIHWIHGIPLRLKSFFDFSFIDKYRRGYATNYTALTILLGYSLEVGVDFNKGVN